MQDFESGIHFRSYLHGLGRMTILRFFAGLLPFYLWQSGVVPHIQLCKYEPRSLLKSRVAESGIRATFLPIPPAAWKGAYDRHQTP